MTTFTYKRSDEWGIRWARPPIAEKLLDPECYVHHSAGAHVNDAATAFRNLNEYAITQKGYSALDYDILVHRNKITGEVTIGEGRGKWMSAATADRNEQGEAVCVLGYFHPGHTLSRQPHPDELEGVALGIQWGMVEGWISPTATILGHRENPAHPGATGCPGDYLFAHMPTIKARVAELQKPPVVVVPPQPPKDDDDMTTAVIWGPEGYANRFLIGAGDVIHLSPKLNAHYKSLGVPEVTGDDHDLTLETVLYASGLNTSDLVL
jgi:hypothetical protein